MVEIKEGSFKLVNKSFWIDETKILIKERKKENITRLKTQYYLEAYQNKEGSKLRTYISSLYEIDSSVFSFDFEGRNFNFVINGTIKEADKVSIFEVV